MSKTLIAWHYTTALGFMGILKANCIHASTTDIGQNEIPTVWFSSNQTMEMTIREVAFKKRDGSILRARNVAEHRLMGCGLYRIGAPIPSLLRYVDTLKAAKIGSTRRRNLEKAAKQVGASPYEWFSVFQSFLLSQAVAVEQFDGLKWVPFTLDEAENKVLKEQKNIEPILTSLLTSGDR